MKKIEVISSKSDAHRALICAALASKNCIVKYNESSKDILATKACLDALLRGDENLYCGESGSTLRFMLPVVAALGKRGLFHPEGRLPERPLSPLYEEMEAHGCTLSPMGSVPFVVEGQLCAGDYHIPGNVSSQYISGLLFALPLLGGNSRIIVEGKLQSAGYVDLTLGVIRRFGIKIDFDGRIFEIKGNQKYEAPEEYVVEGDWSNAAFWLAAGALGGEALECTGLRRDSLQGDKAIVKYLKEFGVKIEEKDNSVTVFPAEGKLNGIKIDAGPIPDMVPILSLIASFASGETEIYNAGRLRIKESDRLASVTSVLNGIGADIEELAEGLIIRGVGRLKGGNVECHNDHRIVMMAAVASLICDDKIILHGWHAVNKSYPSFFDKMKELELDSNIELA